MGITISFGMRRIQRRDADFNAEAQRRREGKKRQRDKEIRRLRD
jgi:hypothetical protein